MPCRDHLTCFSHAMETFHVKRVTGTLKTTTSEVFAEVCLTRTQRHQQELVLSLESLGLNNVNKAAEKTQNICPSLAQG